MYKDEDKLTKLAKLSKKNIKKYTMDEVQYLRIMLEDPSILVIKSAQDTLLSSCQKLTYDTMDKCQKSLKRDKDIPQYDIKENRVWFLGTVKRKLVNRFMDYTGGPIESFIASDLEEQYISLYKTNRKYEEVAAMYKFE